MDEGIINAHLKQIMIDWFLSINGWAKAWIVWILVGIGIQTAATILWEKGQLSHQVWSTIHTEPLLHGCITVFLFWLFYHWSIEHVVNMRVPAIDDFIVVGMGIVVAAGLYMAR